ncbi:PLP-dependent cysteine synthase family protein [Pseudoalteromonas tunicata]|uniref:PLP-dependent cysteine synthase family protein n=1 Tax=Pseudoalteromonas tunicata TaxID=314281 RepID=UPI00273DAB67|nr:PLP-dependent cysteine synthase family protein [Pseudoalteromonas tunicata]MDP5213163.1 PLP-dependent cysteine synthase family protein [Pseudoalteromonas tunicata]
MNRQWLNQAIEKIEADYVRSADTHLILLPLACFPNIDIYLKDESTHPTGSLKHRLARSLFLYALCNGWIDQNTTTIESSSGSTAVSEAYFARLLGLKFIAVMAKTTAAEKIKQIEFYGGQCHLVENTSLIYQESAMLAAKLNGHYMDQFTYAERATDWRGNNNIATSIIEQMKKERFPEPSWVVMSPGTGGTSATIGRYLRYQNLATQLLVVDPTHSVFYDYYQSLNPALISKNASKIEGIGRPRVEPSFVPGVIDDMLKVPDAQSLAAMHWLTQQLGRKVGPSTGTNMVGVLEVAKRMQAAGQSGSIVTLICDSGERYLNTYYNCDWVNENIGLDLSYRDYLKTIS